jgi:hypothetical protein
MQLNARKMGLYLGVSALVALALQLAMGSSIVLVLLALISVATGLLAFMSLGAYNAGAWLALFYMLGNVLVATDAKTLMGQTLGSHLYAPVDSFLVLAVSSTALFVALLIVRKLDLGVPLLRPAEAPHELRWLSWGGFVLGVVFWFVNQHFQQPGGSGFGGFAIFRDLLLMAVIARTALLLNCSGDRRAFDVPLGLIIAVGVFLGVLSNTKAQAAYPVISYFATMLFYRRGLPVRQIVAFAIGAGIFLMVFVPMIQAWRYMGQQQMDVRQRITLIAEGAAAVIQGGQLDHYDELGEIEFRGGSYYNYFGGNGRGQQVLGRYASVQQIDPVIAEVNRQGPIGGSVIWPALTRLLPKIVYSDKPKYTEAYHIVADLGLINPAGGKFPTVPLAGQAYAGYGVMGVLLIPFFTFFVFLATLKKLGWNLHRNVYAIFFYMQFLIVYAGQGTLNQYAGFVLRSAPLFFALFWLLRRLSHVRWGGIPDMPGGHSMER